MRCDTYQQELSARLDGELPQDAEVLDAHVATCADCQAFLAGADQVRRHLRFQPLDADLPDIAAAVRVRIAATGPVPDPPAVTDRPRTRATARGWLSVAASLVVGVVVGASLVTSASRQPVEATVLSQRVLAAQRVVTELAAEVTIEEHGWDLAVPLRRYEGRLDYRAPEGLVIELEDRTTYPSGDWTPNDVVRVVTPDAEWTRAVPSCPAPLRPGCLPDDARVSGWTDRTPFSTPGATALDVVVPVASFRLGGGGDLGIRTVDGEEQLGAAVTVGQLAPLLGALLEAGTWRALHPADPVDLWVDAESLTPRELVVRAGDGADRERWAVERGLTDAPGAVLFRVVLAPTDPAGAMTIPAPPTGLRPQGFVDGPVDLPTPTLPDGMAAYRSGTIRTSEYDIEVATWSDGRAWLRLRGVSEWQSERLFGGLGALVRRETLPDGRVVYVAGSGTAVAVHTDDGEFVVDGSVTSQELLDVAASLPVDGRLIPRTWAEVADATVEEAVAVLPGLLVPADLAGFGPPAIQVRDTRVAIGLAGSGGRELLLTQHAGDRLAPPITAEVVEVVVRGRPGRYLAESSELEWVEDGVIVSLRGDELGRAELLAIAASLQGAS